MAAGVNPEAFWEMTFGEAASVQYAIVQRRNQDSARQAATAYVQADLIVRGVNNLLSKQKVHYPSPGEAFPGLFDADEDQDEDQDDGQAWVAMRANFERYIRATGRTEVTAHG